MSESTPAGRAVLHSTLLWLVWLTLAAACAWVVSRATIVTDITAFLPGPATPAQAQLAEQLRDGVASRVVLIGIEGADAESLAGISQALQTRLAGDARFSWITNGNAAGLTAERDRLFDARYLLSPRVDSGRFTEAGLRHAAIELESLLRSSAAPLVKPFAARDPTGELMAVLSDFSGARAPATQRGVWFDAGGRTAILLATTHAPGFDVDAQAVARSAIDAAFAEVRTTARGDAAGAGLTLHLTGPGMFAVQSREAIQRDAERLAIAAAVLIALLLYVALRSGRLLVAAALPVALGALAGLAAVALGWGSIHGITLGFGMTLIGEAVDYAIYVQVQRRGTDADRALWRTLWLAVLTSGAGFVAMMFSGFQGLVQLGLLSIVGIAVAAAVARTLLPQVLKPIAPAALARMRWVESVQHAGARLRLPVLALAAAAVVFVGFRGPSVWNDELAGISPLARGAGERDARMRGALGMPDMRFVIAVDGATLDEALARAEALHPRLAELATHKTIAGFSSPAQLVPSQAVQEARRAALPDETMLRANLVAALKGTALRAAAFEPFIADVQAARTAPLLTPAYFAGTGLGERLTGQIRRTADSVALFVTLSGVADDAALKAALRDRPNVALLDLKSDVEALVAEYRGKATLAALGGALLIVVLLAVQLRDVRATLRIAASLAAAVAITAAAAVLIEGRLTLFHLVALLLVVGIGSNYALFFALRSDEPRDDGSGRRVAVPASVALCMASTVIAFALLATSGTPVLHMIGLTAALGAAISFLAAIAIAQPPSAQPTRTPTP